MNNATRVVAVIQARMSSTRFPGKMLRPIAGVPLAVHVCRRVADCRAINDVVLATSDDDGDSPLAAAVAAAGFRVFRGSLTDVLGRFVETARAYRADAVVRVTGDCPLIDPEVIDAMLLHFRAKGLAYYSNVSPPSYPEGLDCEIIATDALKIAHWEADDPYYREHVTPYISERPERFAKGNHVCPLGDFSDIQWSVNRPDDLALVEEVMTAAGGPGARLSDLVSLLKDRPDLDARSRHRGANEGGIGTFIASMDRRAPRPSIRESDALWQRAGDIIPAGTQTLSKGPSQFVDGFAPKFLVRGAGSHVWDADGNEYIDYPMGLGPVTLGHGQPEVVEAVTAQLRSGTEFSLMHPLEIELAERICAMVPCAEMVRFGKNGSDATAACVRAARAKTGRTHILRCGYHGWQDWAIDSSFGIRARGVPQEVMALTTPFPYNDPGALEDLLRSEPCAAIIMEPVSLTPPRPGYLQRVRELATEHGAVLIFDEVITGFRYARGGAQEYFQVIPDLCAMGKGVANGLPLSIVCGRREFMQPFERIFFSFTFGGETTALAAAMATLTIMERENYWVHVWRQGAKLQEAYRSLAKEFALSDITDCQGLPPWTIVTFNDTLRWSGLQIKSLFQQEMIRRRVLFSGSQFISLAHSDDDIARTISAYRDAMRVLRVGLDRHAVDRLLQGRAIEPVFRRV